MPCRRWVRYAAGGLARAILFNGERTMLDEDMRAAGLERRLDAVLSADAAGAFKPDQRVYQLAVDRFGCSAGEVGSVFSNAWDAFGASVFGLRVVWVNRAGQPEEHRRTAVRRCSAGWTGWRGRWVSRVCYLPRKRPVGSRRDTLVSAGEPQVAPDVGGDVCEGPGGNLLVQVGRPGVRASRLPGARFRAARQLATQCGSPWPAVCARSTRAVRCLPVSVSALPSLYAVHVS